MQVFDARLFDEEIFRVCWPAEAMDKAIGNLMCFALLIGLIG